jgi:hypothetical protein
MNRAGLTGNRAIGFSRPFAGRLPQRHHDAGTAARGAAATAEIRCQFLR